MNKYKYRKVHLEDITSIAKLVTVRISDTCVPEERITHRTGDKMIYIPNDVSILFNTEKIRKFSPDTVQTVINEFTKAPSSLSQALSKIPDDKIIDSMKSRYIQSTTDIHNFNRWLKHNFEREVERLNEQFKDNDKSDDKTGDNDKSGDKTGDK